MPMYKIFPGLISSGSCFFVFRILFYGLLAHIPQPIIWWNFCSVRNMHVPPNKIYVGFWGVFGDTTDIRN